MADHLSSRSSLARSSSSDLAVRENKYSIHFPDGDQMELAWLTFNYSRTVTAFLLMSLSYTRPFISGSFCLIQIQDQSLFSGQFSSSLEES